MRLEYTNSSNASRIEFYNSNFAQNFNKKRLFQRIWGSLLIIQSEQFFAASELTSGFFYGEMTDIFGILKASTSYA